MSQHHRVGRRWQDEEDELKKKEKKKKEKGGQKTLFIQQSWRNDVGKNIWTLLNFLNFSYADAPTVRHIHTLAYATCTLHQYICIISCGLLHCDVHHIR